MSTIDSHPVNSQSPNGTLGIIPKVGGIAISSTPISADVDLPEIAYIFRSGDTGTANTLLLEGADGNPVAFFNMIQGEEILFETKKVIYQATISGTPYTTNIINLTWMGGQ